MSAFSHRSLRGHVLPALVVRTLQEREVNDQEKKPTDISDKARDEHHDPAEKCIFPFQNTTRIDINDADIHHYFPECDTSCTDHCGFVKHRNKRNE